MGGLPYGLDGGPQRWVLSTMLEHHTYSAFTHFGGKFVLLLHGSIFSDVGASTNPGALQLCDTLLLRMIR